MQENRRSTSYFLNQTMTGADAGPGGRGPERAARVDDRRTRTGRCRGTTTGPTGWAATRPRSDRADWFRSGRCRSRVDGAAVTVNGTLRVRGQRVPVGHRGGDRASRSVRGSRPAHDTTRRRVVAPVVTGLAAIVALGLWLAERSVAPPDAQPTVLPLAPVRWPHWSAAVVAAVRPAWRTTALLAAVALLAGWAVVRLTVWWKPLLPTAAPDWVDRGGTALVVGVGIGVAVSLLQRPVATPVERRGVPGVASSSEPA